MSVQRPALFTLIDGKCPPTQRFLSEQLQPRLCRCSQVKADPGTAFFPWKQTLTLKKRQDWSEISIFTKKKKRERERYILFLMCSSAHFLLRLQFWNTPWHTHTHKKRKTQHCIIIIGNLFWLEKNKKVSRSVTCYCAETNSWGISTGESTWTWLWSYVVLVHSVVEKVAKMPIYWIYRYCVVIIPEWTVLEEFKCRLNVINSNVEVRTLCFLSQYCLTQCFPPMKRYE